MNKLCEYCDWGKTNEVSEEFLCSCGAILNICPACYAEALKPVLCPDCRHKKTMAELKNKG